MTRRCVSARLYSGLFPLFCALFFSLAFSFAISMTFPVFGAPRRPVNRLYFFTGGLGLKSAWRPPQCKYASLAYRRIIRVLLKYDPSLLIDCFIIQVQRLRSSYHSGSTTSSSLR